MMRTNKLFCVGLLIIGVIFSHEAGARGPGRHFSRGFHHHPGLSLHFGLPLFSYPYYPYPYYRYPYYYDYPYYYSPVIPVPSTPPVYIEQPKPEIREYPAGYWYYCSSPEGYYPYVKECPDGWQQIEPAPSSPR